MPHLHCGGSLKSHICCFVDLPAVCRSRSISDASDRRLKENTTSGELRCPSVVSVLTLNPELSGTERSGFVALSLLNTWRRNWKILGTANISIGGLGTREVFRQGFRSVELRNTQRQEPNYLKVYQVFDVWKESSHSKAADLEYTKMNSEFWSFHTVFVHCNSVIKVILKIQVFWYVAPCLLIAIWQLYSDRYECFSIRLLKLQNSPKVMLNGTEECNVDAFIYKYVFHYIHYRSLLLL